MEKEPKPKARGSSTPCTPAINRQGAADRRRLRRITAAPCPFGSAYVAERCGQSSATLSDHVFPESVWKAFGEHVGGERGSGGEGGTRKKRRRPLGSLLGHCWGLLGASWGPLGGLLGGSLGFLGALGGSFGASLAVLGRSWPVGCRRKPSWGPLWVVLGPSWGTSGPSWRPSWASWRPLGPSWGPLGAVLGASWAVMGPSWRPLGRS